MQSNQKSNINIEVNYTFPSKGEEQNILCYLSYICMEKRRIHTFIKSILAKVKPKGCNLKPDSQFHFSGRYPLHQPHSPLQNFLFLTFLFPSGHERSLIPTISCSLQPLLMFVMLVYHIITILPTISTSSSYASSLFPSYLQYVLSLSNFPSHLSSLVDQKFQVTC